VSTRDGLPEETKPTGAATGFYDARCPKCGKRFGWHGRLTDKPACPRCGHRDDPAALARDEAEIERVLQDDFDG